MSNSLGCQNSQIPQMPYYSGVTINISNPMVSTTPVGINTPANLSNNRELIDINQNEISTNKMEIIDNPNLQQSLPNTQNIAPYQSYPSQYYMNNYNYIENKEQSSQADQPSIQQLSQFQQPHGIQQTQPAQQELNNARVSSTTNNPNNADINSSEFSQNQSNKTNNISENAQTDMRNDNDSIIEDSDMSSSKEIIDDLNTRVKEEKEQEKNSKQTRVIALTNEYIMSLENYLNNQNKEVRLMAAKEILKRLDEDKSRYDDPALNALLNKMLQDPDKIIRISALSAFSSQLAKGNDYSVQLLTNIQNNPNSDKEDVVEAANALLKMSSSSKIAYTPINNNG